MIQAYVKWISQTQKEEICCQFLPPGGSMVTTYVLPLLSDEKSQNC
jgi:hypothetical protein